MVFLRKLLILQVRSALEGQLESKLELILGVQSTSWRCEGHLETLGEQFEGPSGVQVALGGQFEEQNGVQEARLGSTNGSTEPNFAVLEQNGTKKAR